MIFFEVGKGPILISKEASNPYYEKSKLMGVPPSARGQHPCFVGPISCGERGYGLPTPQPFRHPITQAGRSIPKLYCGGSTQFAIEIHVMPKDIPWPQQRIMVDGVVIIVHWFVE
jgi:hypothetical protein